MYGPIMRNLLFRSVRVSKTPVLKLPNNEQMIAQMAIAIAFPGFNDLGRTVTPVFLLMNHFLYQFSALSEKMKKIYRLDV